jgi:hypothetical protein
MKLDKCGLVSSICWAAHGLTTAVTARLKARPGAPLCIPDLMDDLAFFLGKRRIYVPPYAHANLMAAGPLAIMHTNARRAADAPPGFLSGPDRTMATWAANHPAYFATIAQHYRALVRQTVDIDRLALRVTRCWDIMHAFNVNAMPGKSVLARRSLVLAILQRFSKGLQASLSMAPMLAADPGLAAVIPRVSFITVLNLRRKVITNAFKALQDTIQWLLTRVSPDVIASYITQGVGPLMATPTA